MFDIEKLLSQVKYPLSVEFIDEQTVRIRFWDEATMQCNPENNTVLLVTETGESASSYFTRGELVEIVRIMDLITGSQTDQEDAP